MKHLSKILFTTLSLGMLATPALAQDAAEGEAPAEGEGTAETTAETGEAAPADPAATAEAAPGAGQTVGPFTKEGYPTELIYRPLTLPKGMIEVRPEFSYSKLSATVGGITTSAEITGLAVGVGYGVTDKLEVGLATGLRIDPDAGWGESIGLYGAFSVMDTEKMDLAPSVGTSLNFGEDADLINAISIGAGFRYVLSNKLFVRAGDDAISFAVAPEVGMRLNINGGVGFQVNKNLAVALDLNLISLKLFGEIGDSAFFDPFGVALTGLYAVNNKIDVYLNIGLPSVADAGDLYSLAVGANIRL